MLAVTSPFPQYFDLSGAPLNGGYLYFGLPNLNPETNPITVYWDAAGTIPAAQPIRTLNGYPVRNGSPALIYANQALSLNVRNSAGVLVFYAPTSLNTDIAVQLSNSTGSNLIGFSQTGTYAQGTVGLALQAWVNVKNAPYNCLVDGVTDDTAGYQAALNAASTVYIPAGTLIHSNVSVPAGRTITGAGRNATTLKLKNTVNVDGHSITNVNDVEFKDLTLDGNSANNLTAGNGSYITGTSSRVRFVNARMTNWRLAGAAGGPGTSYIEALHCRIDNNIFDGFQMTTVAQPSILFCDVESNGRFGAVFGTACTNVRDIGNNYRANAQGGSIMVGGNDAIRLGNIADTNGTGHGLQYNATLRGLYVGNISKGNGISGFDHTLGASYGLSLGNISYANAIRGFEIDSATYYNITMGNVVYRNGEVGISVYRSPTTRIIGNQSLENGTTTAPKFGIRLWDDLNTLPSNNCAVLGNNSTDDRGGSATQTYGLSIEAASAVGTIVDGNKLDANVTGPVSAVAGSILRARDNQGWVTQSEGSSSIASGTTAITISHGLASTPTANNFTLEFTNGATTDPGQVWISAITSTQFTVNCRNNPGAGGANFLWRASLY